MKNVFYIPMQNILIVASLQSIYRFKIKLFDLLGYKRLNLHEIRIFDFKYLQWRMLGYCTLTWKCLQKRSRTCKWRDWSGNVKDWIYHGSLIFMWEVINLLGLHENTRHFNFVDWFINFIMPILYVTGTCTAIHFEAIP